MIEADRRGRKGPSTQTYLRRNTLLEYFEMSEKKDIYTSFQKAKQKREKIPKSESTVSA
jgi:hypothetical protein